MKHFCLLVLLASMPLMAVEGKRNNVYTTEWDTILPHLVDGPGWTSKITLVNMGDVAAPYELWLYREDGTPWNLQFKGLTGASNKWTGTIPVGGSVFLETPGGGTATTVGWAEIKSDFWVSGMGAFKAGWLNSNDKEAVVPFTSWADFRFFIPFDNRNGQVTSIAIVNPLNDLAARISVIFRNTDGSVILRDDNFTLQPLQHRAFSTVELYGSGVNGKNGAIEFVVAGDDATASALGLQFNDARNSFTSVHPVSIDLHYYNATQ